MNRPTLTKPKVWITRTFPAAHESARAWRDVGAETIILPLLNVVPVDHHGGLLERSTLVFTSKNGVEHFKPDDRRRPSQTVCVGDATAARAQAAGYPNVVSVDGTSEDVTAYIRANHRKCHHVLHVSGKHVRGAIVEDLEALGFRASRRTVYRSEPILRMPERPMSHVALYSPLAAQTFARLPKPPNCTAISISPATDAALEGLDLAGRLIAERPNEAAMLALLKPAKDLG